MKSNQSLRGCGIPSEAFKKSPRIMIVAGEASGESHGASVALQLFKLFPSADIFGMGGKRMSEAGVRIIVDASTMAVMGLSEVIAHLPLIYRTFKKLSSIFTDDPPDLLILIDYPDFNLRLAKKAKKSGVKVLYFISPQVWAWREGRVHTIAKRVDHIAVLFPFEVPYYERVNLPVTFAGHPSIDALSPSINKKSLYEEFGLDPEKPVVGLFPGSRKGEIKALLEIIVKSAELIRDKLPKAQFILPLASTLALDDIAPYLTPNLQINIVPDRSLDVIEVCDSIIAASGTVTLEIALRGVPMVIVYKVSPFTYFMGKVLINVDHVGICNIVAGKRVVPELIQEDADPSKIAVEILRFFNDMEYVTKVKSELAEIKDKLGSPGVAARVAETAASMILAAKVLTTGGSDV